MPVIFRRRRPCRRRASVFSRAHAIMLFCLLRILFRPLASKTRPFFGRGLLFARRSTADRCLFVNPPAAVPMLFRIAMARPWRRNKFTSCSVLGYLSPVLFLRTRCPFPPFLTPVHFCFFHRRFFFPTRASLWLFSTLSREPSFARSALDGFTHCAPPVLFCRNAFGQRG